MKAIASLAFGLASAAGVCIAGASVASYVVAEPERTSLRLGLQPDLWTLEPARVVQSQQHYERLPAMLSSYAEQERDRASLIPKPTPQPQVPAVEPTLPVATHSAGHLEWCSAKYRSYDPATDTYRSFSGERRACISSNADVPSPVATTMSVDQDHARWCAARYASYRTTDNTYQPFAGPRLACQAPGDVNRQVATIR